ncbi:hypothetical protein, partial [Escherichia coli]|uniref:hypothetical protein n=1 Tax=Escherichia coli TaxID=562 RepID=UPI00215A84AB
MAKPSKPVSPVLKKKKGRTKSLTDIITVEETEDDKDHDFKKKYISRNAKWEKQLKLTDKSNYKK